MNKRKLDPSRQAHTMTIGSDPGLSRQKERTHVWLSFAVCTCLFGVLCARSLLLQHLSVHRTAFQDDAYYYFLIARHLVSSGKSTFDGITLTNGYHPLWLGILTLQYRLFGPSMLLTRCIEFSLGFAALWSLLRVAKLPSMLLNLLYTTGLFAVISMFAFNGMETTALACCYGLFTFASTRHSSSVIADGILDGCLAAATIAARIDAGVFIVPQLLFASTSRLRRGIALGVIALSGGAYMLVNSHLFSSALPISGDVKALGGLQINRALLHQLLHSTEAPIFVFRALLLLTLVSPFLLRFVHRPLLRAILLAFSIGMTLFFVRLEFFSSWAVWPWYNFPILLVYVACAPAVLLFCDRHLFHLVSPRQRNLAFVAVVLVAVAVFMREVAQERANRRFGPERINQLAIHESADLLNASVVAMGDHAGNFAFQYPGHVVQLEGLVGDRQYLNLLKRKADVRPFLCENGAHFLVSYEPDLGAYTTHLVDTIHPNLSQYQAPQIPVAAQDQVARFGDLSHFKSSRSYLYMWRLHCPPASTPN